MPQNIYKSNTLVSLKLVAVGLETPNSDVSLPCLKIFPLEHILYDDDSLTLEKLISGCSVLEDFTMIRQTYTPGTVMLSLRMRSQSLKSFRLTFEYTMEGADFSVEIDAPKLKYLSFKDKQSDKIVIKNLSSLLKIDIDTEFHAKYGDALDPKERMKRYTISDFLTALSNVKHMIISQRTVEVCYIVCSLSIFNPIPIFDNLYRLQAASCSYMLQLLPIFLESCPNLKDLVLDCFVSTEPELTELSYVPQCLLSSLESFEIRGLSMDEETGKKLVRYFLENSVLLKKLILRFKDYSIPNYDSDILKGIRTFTKRSHKCQIIIH
ncbi:F-box/FBD/LRR-repeat protein At2g26030-like [Brassica napus]|uniref:F-box/FBD/LRR-repeat protein At2g26030-like n=1 Tax=Brassica napus TaxID=3708 RepID=UPI002078E52D|nr:F-box/FBD/LRR-repeat protein At2g26030-like [Brassica napus]